jgi:hypothetical protein
MNVELNEHETKMLTFFLDREIDDMKFCISQGAEDGCFTIGSYVHVLEGILGKMSLVN